MRPNTFYYFLYFLCLVRHFSTSSSRTMTSNNNLQVKPSPQKTYSAFNALPTLRARDRKDTDKSPARTFKRPPQMADQLLFPGRRLDRLQRSTYSGYSGRSLEIETIVSGGRLNSAAPVDANGGIGLGVGKQGSALSGFSRSMNDVTNQPWDSLRQLPSAHTGSQLSLLSSQGKQNPRLGGAPRLRGIAAQNAGWSVSMGSLNADAFPNSFPAPSGRWQLSGANRRHLPDKTILDSGSPDSSYSSETAASESAHEPTPVPPPKIQLHRPHTNLSREPKQTLKKQRRHSEVVNESRTPQLDKILWALVPDEFANISDTGVSEHNGGNASPHYLNFTDLEHSEAASSGEDADSSGHPTSRIPTTRVPATPRRPTLTEESLSHFSRSLPNDDRIQQWLAECDAHACSNKLPTHLPDINYTFKLPWQKNNNS